MNADSTVDLWKLRESILGRKGRGAPEVRRKIRKMAGETENFRIAEFSSRIRDKREQNRLIKKKHTHTNTHAWRNNSPLFKVDFYRK